MATGRWVLGLLVVTAALYAPVRTAPMVYEDTHTANAAVQWSVPSRAFSHWTFQQTEGRPDRAHLVNVGLHLVNGLLVYALVVALIPGTAAVWASGIWLLHPLNSAAVSYISARTDLLVTFGVLLALVAMLQARWGWYRWVGVAAGGLVAAASKEIGLIAGLLLVLTLLIWRPTWTLARWSLVGGGTLAGLALLPRLASWVAMDPAYGGSAVPLSEFLILQLAATWHLLLLVVPSPLWLHSWSIDHDALAIGMVGQVSAVMVTGGALAVVAALWRITPALTWAVLWVAVALLPRFLAPSSEFVTEPQMALPMVGISVGLGVWASRLWAWRPSTQKAIVYG